MSNLEKLKQDITELNRLSELTTSNHVKQILTNEAEKLKKEALLLEERQKSSASKADQKVASRSYVCNVKIINYGWDQSDKFVKLYINLSNIHSLPAENVTSAFRSKSMELQVIGLENKNHSLTINNLMHEISPQESYHKVKKDMIVVFLRKESLITWPYITESEKKAKEPRVPKMEDNEDPGQSLMTLMKQMYDEGDDEMKRTIAKAWTEAREKQVSGDII